MLRSTAAFLLTTVCLGIAVTAEAGFKNHLKIDKHQDVDFGVWAVGDGSQTTSQLRCVSSASYNNAYFDPPPVLWPPARRLNYSYRITDDGSPGGYFLYLDDDDTNTGNARLPVRFRHRDVKEPVAWESLADGVYDAHTHLGQFRKCSNGDNSDLEVQLLAIDLDGVRAGDYRGNFTASARGGFWMSKEDSTSFVVDITVSEVVQISALDNIGLGAWSGGDVSQVESFCVYSNNDAAAYNVTITSPNQDGADNFFVVNSGATASVAYTLYFKDSVGGGNGSTVGAGAHSGVGDNGASDCGGADNAKITVEFTESDLEAAGADTYTDTVTLLIAPE